MKIWETITSVGGAIKTLGSAIRDRVTESAETTEATGVKEVTEATEQDIWADALADQPLEPEAAVPEALLGWNIKTALIITFAAAFSAMAYYIYTHQDEIAQKGHEWYDSGCKWYNKLMGQTEDENIE